MVRLRFAIKPAHVDQSLALPVAAAAVRQISAIVPCGGEHARGIFSGKRLRRGPLQDNAVSSRQRVRINGFQVHLTGIERNCCGEKTTNSLKRNA